MNNYRFTFKSVFVFQFERRKPDKVVFPRSTMLVACASLAHTFDPFSTRWTENVLPYENRSCGGEQAVCAILFPSFTKSTIFTPVPKHSIPRQKPYSPVWSAVKIPVWGSYRDPVLLQTCGSMIVPGASKVPSTYAVKPGFPRWICSTKF